VHQLLPLVAAVVVTGLAKMVVLVVLEVAVQVLILEQQVLAHKEQQDLLVKDLLVQLEQ
jgi:hypothetical protein